MKGILPGNPEDLQKLAHLSNSLKLNKAPFALKPIPIKFRDRQKTWGARTENIKP